MWTLASNATETEQGDIAGRIKVADLQMLK